MRENRQADHHVFKQRQKVLHTFAIQKYVGTASQVRGGNRLIKMRKNKYKFLKTISSQVHTHDESNL